MSPPPKQKFPELWALIRESPRDFDARRVLCDALLSEGDSFGEFMREALLPKAQRNRERAKALLEKHRYQWYPQPPFGSGNSAWPHVDSVLASGGVPDHAFLHTVAHLDWWERHYPLRELGFEVDADHLVLFGELVKRGHLAKLEQLNLRIRSEVEGAEALIARIEPGLLKLDLTLFFNTAGPDLPVLPWLEKLTDLRLVTASAYTLEKLWPGLHALERVELLPNWREPFKVPETVLSPLAHRALRTLKIDSGPRSSAMQLLNATDPARLERLELINGFLRTELDTFSERAKMTGLPALEVLQLFGQGLSGVPEILNASLPNLRELDLRSNHFASQDLQAITQLPFFSQLTRVGFSLNQIDSDEHPATLDTVRRVLKIPESIEVF